MKKINIIFDPKILFSKIRSLRGAQTLKAFSKKYKIAVATLKNYESIRVPPFEFLVELHKKEGVSLDWLIEEKDQETDIALESPSFYKPETLSVEERDLLNDYRKSTDIGRKTGRMVFKMNVREQERSIQNRPKRKLRFNKDLKGKDG